MPQNTPRGYSYPLYTDAGHNFPAAIQDLATDIDTDVQGQVNELADNLDQPSATVSSNVVLAMPINTDVTVTWAVEEYDNAGLWTAGSPNIMTFNEVGLYLIQAYAVWSSNADSTTSACGLRIVSSANGVRARHDVRRGINATPDTITAYTEVSTLHEIQAPGETITIIARHNLVVPSQLTNRRFSATKIAEDN